VAYQYVHGLEHELKKLAEFPVKVEQRIVRASLRAGAKKVLQVIVPRVPRVSGDLAATVRVSTRKRGRTISAAVKVGDRKKGVFYAGHVMRGTKPHLISARNQPALTFGGVIRRSVQHPGAKAQNFMEEGDRVGREPAFKEIFRFATEQLKKLIAEQGNAP
jgi:hypothetical protein